MRILRRSPRRGSVDMRILLCIYTCEEDQDYLGDLENTEMMVWARSKENIRVIKVLADERLTRKSYLADTLTVPCREDYAALSVKTFQMVKACLDFDFQYLLKIDSTLARYPDKRPLDAPAIMKKVNSEAALGAIADPRFFGVPYNGLMRVRTSEGDFNGWMRRRGLAGSYRSVFPSGKPTPPYFLGKFYSLRRDFASFIAETGWEMAVQHVNHLGGSEDVMVGRLYDQWTRTKDGKRANTVSAQNLWGS